MVNEKAFILMLLLFLVALKLWRTAFAYPLRLAVTLFHETGHLLGAVATGGILFGMEVNAEDLSGRALKFEGSKKARTVGTNMGYLGSIGFGLLIYMIPFTRLSGASLLITGILILLVTLAWVKETAKGIAYCMLLGAALIIMHFMLSATTAAYATMFIGICIALYSFLEIDRCDSDAHSLSCDTHIPAFLWKGLWLFSSGLVFALMAYMALYCMG